MVDTQHFCLRWNNYQSSITSAFENLRDDEDFVDVTLACDGKSLKAHRVVLSACSPYFRELLKVRVDRIPALTLRKIQAAVWCRFIACVLWGRFQTQGRTFNSAARGGRCIDFSCSMDATLKSTTVLARFVVMRNFFMASLRSWSFNFKKCTVQI